VSTIKQVAQRAGVAISTVSAVINRSAPVSPATIARVQQAIGELGYLPHGGAQSLRTGQSRMIGLVVPNIANPIFAAMAKEVENVCLSAGYTSVVFSTGQDDARESQVLTMMRVQRFAGLILIPTRSDSAHGSSLREKIFVPTVLLDMPVEGLPFDVIKTDNVEAGRLATRHLLELGHRRVGIVVGIPGLVTNDDRHAGYAKAHQGLGLMADPALCAEGHFDEARAFDATLALLSRTPRPTALVTLSNMMTMGALFAIRKLGLRVPDDISLVGIDDFDFAEILDPQPTLVATPITVIAKRAIQALLGQMAASAPPSGKIEVYPPRLIVRHSTAPAPDPTTASASISTS
jgi:LacI family transcriptional regulator